MGIRVPFGVMGALLVFSIAAYGGPADVGEDDPPYKSLRLGFDEPLDAASVIEGALASARVPPADVPVFVRLIVDAPIDGAAFDFEAFEQRIEAYHKAGIRVLLTIRSLAPTAEGAEGWRQFVRTLAERSRDRVIGYQLGAPAAGEPRPAAREYAFLLKLAAVQIRSVDADAVVGVATVRAGDSQWIAELFKEDVAAYVDLIAVDGSTIGEAAFGPQFTALQEAVAKEDATATVMLAGVPLGADGTEAKRRWVLGQLGYLGTRPTIVTFTGPEASISAALQAASSLKDLLAGEVVTLDERAASLRLGLDGRDVTARVPHRLLYNLSNFSTYLVLWADNETMAGRLDVEVELRDPAGRTPMLRDAVGGRVDDASGFAWDKASSLSRLRAQASPSPLVIDFNYGAGDVYVDRADVRQKVSLRVDEIVFRYQQAQAAQDAIVDRYLARARMEQHFRPSPTDAIDVVTENRFFWDRDGAEWEEISFSVNGAKWGPNRPAFPLLQPEKVLSLPLDLRLGRDYTYTLDGTETVGGRRCYVVRFAPVTDSQSLYSGKVWIDAERFVRLKIQAVQTRMTAPVVSNEEIQTFEPVAEIHGQPVYLFTHLTSRQIFLIAGRNLLVEKEVRFADFQVNGAEFAVTRDAARASDRVMYRDTDQGLRYFVKRGEQRIVSDQLTMSAKALAIGTTIDPSFDFPLPILGINYLDFDFLSKDSQLALLFGGVLAAGNIQQPKLFRTPFDASVDFFGIAVPATDQLYDRAGERRAERLLTIPASTGVNLGWQFTSFQKLALNYQFRYDFFFRDRQTEESYVVPASTATNGIGFTWDYKRAGYNVRLTASRNHRATWRSWGRPGALERPEPTYDKYALTVSKDFFINTFHKIHVDGAYFGGEKLDRFSMYQFGLFDETRMHGVPAVGVRFAELGMARASYSFNVFEQYRLDLFYDQAWGRDPFERSRWLPITGTGVAVNLRGPWNTMFKADVGKSFLPELYAGSGSFVLQILLLKPL